MAKNLPAAYLYSVNSNAGTFQAVGLVRGRMGLRKGRHAECRCGLLPPMEKRKKATMKRIIEFFPSILAAFVLIPTIRFFANFFDPCAAAGLVRFFAFMSLFAPT